MVAAIPLTIAGPRKVVVKQAAGTNILYNMRIIDYHMICPLSDRAGIRVGGRLTNTTVPM